MAKTLLDAVNELLKRVNEIAGDAAALTSLTDSARQHRIDVAVQVINEGIDELYSTSQAALPKEGGSATITLATGTRAYALATDLVQLRWPMIDRTNSQYLEEFPGDYEDMLLLDPEQDDTGQPHFGLIRPTDGYLFLDRAPLAADNGKIYTYQYDKDLALTLATDTVPFSNATFRAMVPAWVQLYKREQRAEFDKDLWQFNLGRASRLVTETLARSDYSPR